MLKKELVEVIGRKDAIIRQLSEVNASSDKEIKQLIAYKDSISKDNLTLNRSIKAVNKDNDDMSMTIAEMQGTIDDLRAAKSAQGLRLFSVEDKNKRLLESNAQLTIKSERVKEVITSILEL